MRAVLLSLVFVALMPRVGHSWSDRGHHIIATFAYRLLNQSSQWELQRILSEHAQYWDVIARNARHIDNPGTERTFGSAGCWPDVARKHPKYDRPRWHYQLGASKTMGVVEEVPLSPMELPPEASLESQELHIHQALRLCANVLADEKAADGDRAIALCWVLHLVADGHQPCHAGSLYVERVFPEGDRGGNSVPVKQGGNLHALWDGLLGSGYDAGKINREVEAMHEEFLRLQPCGLLEKSSSDIWSGKWLEESRECARQFVYDWEAIKPIKVAVRVGTTDVQQSDLSERYLSQAGRIARIRAMIAGVRLAAVLEEALPPEWTDE